MLAYDISTVPHHAAPAGPGLHPGERIDGMTIVAAHSRGGFAHIYEARLDSGRRVAIKMLLPHIAAMRGVVARMRLEAAMLAQLDHPHIVEVFGGGDYRGQPYIAMEFLDGCSLADELVRRGALSATTTLALLEQVCGAVETAHASGIVHRDLKAQNIVVLGRDPLAIKLVDFGIAKLLRTQGPGITTSMQVVGTPIAMAPEQLLGGTIDERTDIYALGAVLYHCLAGQPAFTGKSVVELEELHISAPPPRISDLLPALAPVDAVIRRAMAKAATARHPHVAAFLADLRHALGAPAARQGAAVYVEADCADADLDALDRAMGDAEHVLRNAGLDIVATAGNALLARAALPCGGDALVRGAVDAALTIAQPRMGVRVRAAVDLVTDDTPAALGPKSVANLETSGVAASAGVLAVTTHTGEPIADTLGMFRLREAAGPYR
jgi:hypothetical protein